MFKTKKTILTMAAGLFVTAAMATSAFAASYQIKPNDTLWNISQSNQAPLSTIESLNPNVDPMNLQTGQVIQLPDAKSTTQTPPQTQTSVPSDVMQVVNLVNSERSKAGLSPLKLSVSLDKMASAKAADMRDNNYFDHTSPTYGSPFNMMTQFGVSYSYAGENIAAGQQSPTEVMNAWMNSSGHRANILNPNYTEIGVGIASGGSYRTYWVQEFIRP